MTEIQVEQIVDIIKGRSLYKEGTSPEACQNGAQLAGYRLQEWEDSRWFTLHVRLSTVPVEEREVPNEEVERWVV